MDPFIVLQYISSSIDVIINLKFEDIEKKMMSPRRSETNDEDLFKKVDAISINSNEINKKDTRKKGKDQNKSNEILKPNSFMDRLGKINTDRHHHVKSVSNVSDDYSTSSYGGPSCPRVYEEIIQELEGDIRKHIRMEHQLKLHIESVEDRVEELEKDMETKDKTIASSLKELNGESF
jgi:hypothetical protein